MCFENVTLLQYQSMSNKISDPGAGRNWEVLGSAPGPGEDLLWEDGSHRLNDNSLGLLTLNLRPLPLGLPVSVPKIRL